MKNIIVIGPSDLFEFAEAAGYVVFGYFGPSPVSSDIHKRHEFLGNDDRLKDGAPTGLDVAVAIADNQRRRSLFLEIAAADRRILTIRHPSSEVMASATVGEGCIVAPMAVIATNATLGKGVIVNYGALVGHDVCVGEFCFLGPGAKVLNSAVIGKDSVLGANCVIMPGIKIGDGAKVSPNVVVTRDVADNVTLMAVTQLRVLEGTP